MEISKLKYSLSAISLACMLSLSGCSKTSDLLLDRTEEIIVDDELKSEEAKEVVILSKKEIDKLKERIEIETTYLCYTLNIKSTDNWNARQWMLTDEEYSYINTLLNQPSIKNLNLEMVNFDFTHLDILNLESVDIRHDVNFDNVKGIMKKASDNNIDLCYFPEQQDHIKVLNYMIDNDISCDSLIMGVKDEETLTEILRLLEKVKVKSINLVLAHIEKEDISINVKLNDYTSNISLSSYYLSDNKVKGDKRLLDVNISSNNSGLSIVFSDVVISENTKFIVPNNSSIWINNSSYTDITPFYDLEKTKHVYYNDVISNKEFSSYEFEKYGDFVAQIKNPHEDTYTIINPEDIKVRDEIVIPKDSLSQQYLQKEYEYYKTNPEFLEKDAQKYEIVIDPRGKTYSKSISYQIKDMENEFGDIAYINTYSVGNASSDGTGVATKSFIVSEPFASRWKLVAIVGVKSESEYPFAVAEYDEETNTIGDIIGWYKDEDINCRFDTYADVIEMPISKYITYGNIDSFDIDENGNYYNFMYRLPYGNLFASLVENNRYGIMIDYTCEEKDGYYSYSSSGIYVPIEDREEVRSKLDEKNLELTKKIGIKNN